MSSPKTIPEGYQLVQTEDGSFTFYSENYDETCHSSSGADSETQRYFIEGCEIKNKLETFHALNILEIGFGVGRGFLQTLDALKKFTSLFPIHFVSTEIDERLVKWFIGEYSDQWNFLQSFKQVNGNYHFQYQKLKLTILIGDATQSLKKFQNSESLFKAHAIFQDAFSPKKNPELWSKTWFSLLKDLSGQDVTLTTYSASHSVLESLERAGWHWEKIKGFARKRAATRAFLKEIKS
ncbi:MAG: tRNA (5-methylaminomethyl-2-thiouridine)(34)-methyltransferase MnmD [Halobacteriovoraceae bacterium]|nr:tRNA (5-methylaminomethyl-2-thiouridine)(34)-methyltransferase MnmD [Halobacteriovoraceae bacterium]MCB9093558.1 tRNA (5-methylaminomethyl-2-thiouridine)(34)-methyltransferase MnmD [Halobacteriovoraceae bacterium]